MIWDWEWLHSNTAVVEKNIHGRTVISRFQHNNTINCKHLDEAQKSILKSVNSTRQNKCISRSKADLELLSLKNQSAQKITNEDIYNFVINTQNTKTGGKLLKWQV